MAITHVRKDYIAATNSYGPEHTVTEYEDRDLLKKDSEWNDRKADGVWVPGAYLQNREPMKGAK